MNENSLTVSTLKLIGVTHEVCGFFELANN